MQKQSNGTGVPRLLSEALRRLIDVSRVRTFPNNSVLFREKERVQHIFLIESGWVLLTGKSVGALARHGKWWSQREDIPLAAVSSGGMVGAIPVLHGERAAYSAVARGPCLCLVSDAAILERAVASLADRLGAPSVLDLASAVSRIGGSQHLLRLPELFLLDPPERVEHLLRSLSPPEESNGSNGDVRLEIPFNHNELGALVHLDGKTFGRALANLVRSGRVRHDGRALVLRSRASFELPPPAALDPTGVY